ncbi:MAG: dihydrofolate reductase family protein [Galbitalea sp.]
MILGRVFPERDDPIDLDAPDARDRIAELYRPPRPDWLRLNLIGSVSGGATGPDGTSETLTNTADRVVLGVIRTLADVVVVGAASVRAEGYFVPRRAALAVVTRTGDLTGHRITNTGQRGPLIVLCPAAAVATARRTLGDPAARVIAVPDVDGSLEATAIVDALREADYEGIVAEGGPGLAAQLVLGGVVDELCLTTSPLLNGAAVPLLGPSEFAPRPLTLGHLLVDGTGATYARWLLGATAGSAASS